MMTPPPSSSPPDRSPAVALLEHHRPVAAQIAQALTRAKRVLIGTHEHPDGDAVGSALALRRVLLDLGAEVYNFIPNPAPPFLSFLPGYDTLTTVRPGGQAFDVMVLLDATHAYRTHLSNLVASHPCSIVVDHHFGNPGEGTLNLVIPSAAATAEILYTLFVVEQLPITRDVATCLLTGIFSDTGSFVHESTTPEILEMASDLMQRGARLSHIAHETYRKKDLPSLRIWGRALSRVMVSPHTGASVSVVTYDDLQTCGATLDDLSGVVNLLNTLPHAKFALLLVEYEPGRIKGSLRSEPTKAVDVSEIAKRLGGGGHRLASGFEVAGHIVEREGQWRVVAELEDVIRTP